MKIADISVFDLLPERDHQPSNVSLFLYNAAIWNAHRIHYDDKYAKNIEMHPDIVIDGPLQGDWMAQCVSNWLKNHGIIKEFEYSNRKAAYLGESLKSGGQVKSICKKTFEVYLELWVKNAKGEVISPGSALVGLD